MEPAAARAGARMAFDSTNRYVVMFGGNVADTHTYTFDGTNWTDRGATAGPTSGADANGMAFDANVGKVVVWEGLRTRRTRNPPCGERGVTARLPGAFHRADPQGRSLSGRCI